MLVPSWAAFVMRRTRQRPFYPGDGKLVVGTSGVVLRNGDAKEIRLDFGECVAIFVRTHGFLALGEA